LLPQTVPGATRARIRSLIWRGLWLAPVLTGLASIQLGKSASFDFQVYHYYNAYAVLTGRMGFDIIPTGRQTFYNPAADVFLYGLIENLPARVAGFILGAIHGLNFILAAAIASRVLPRPQSLLSEFLPVLLAGTGFLGAVNFGLIGSFHHDNVVSLFFLLSLLVLCGPLTVRGLGDRKKLGLLFFAGVSAGAGVGLKLSLVPFAVAICFGPMFLSWPILRRLAGMIACGVGEIAGLLATGGLHMLRMYHLFGNPVFPFFAGFSAAPYNQFISARDLRYQPDGFLEYLTYPFIFAFRPLRASEFTYRDFRLPVTLAVVFAFLAVLGWRYLTTRSASPVWRISPVATTFLGIIALAYVAWLNTVSLYRYALPLELLSFIVLAILLSDMLGRKWGGVALILLAAALIPTTERFGIGRRAWGDERFVATRLPDRPRVMDNAIVFLVGANGGTYFIPAIPRSVRFLGIDVVDSWPPHTGEFRGPPVPEAMLEPFSSMMHKIADEHKGQVLVVFLDNELDRVEAALRSYHFGFDMRSCGVIRSNVAAVPPLQLCEVKRDLPRQAAAGGR
jgi:hypothetical protein